jgi:aspartyl-tRNA(Asn)/glutamyl-tRNA(Gln) amidotransferase subunit B
MSPSTATRWEPVVGLEVHVQLATRSKMFCRCPARFGSAPNTLVCPICSGQPGTLPVLNADALRLGVLAGLALGCTVDPSTKFDRKNYFYPDLPKGYQISQFDRPLCRDGVLDYELPEGGERRVRIVRAHLEEDSGKIVHPGGMEISLIDLNRAGTPLLEIVSAPDLRSTAEASAYLQALRRVLRYAGVSECDMEKGSFRCDANISLRPAGSDTLGTRTEVKNLNSFRFVTQALQAEIDRQTRVLDGGGEVVQATMAFDPATGRTSTMRTKEEAHDYRYFPEPDLPEFVIDPGWVEELRALLPEDPTARRHRFIETLGLAERDADSLIAERELADYFEATLAAGAGDPAGTHARAPRARGAHGEREVALRAGRPHDHHAARGAARSQRRAAGRGARPRPGLRRGRAGDADRAGHRGRDGPGGALSRRQDQRAERAAGRGDEGLGRQGQPERGARDADRGARDGLTRAITAASLGARAYGASAAASASSASIASSTCRAQRNLKRLKSSSSARLSGRCVKTCSKNFSPPKSKACLANSRPWAYCIILVRARALTRPDPTEAATLSSSASITL